MKIIVTASTKGGVGKSTIGACLAVEAARQGCSVYIVDLDPQQSTARWWVRAGGPDNPMLVTGVDNVTLARHIIEQKKAGRDYFIVDTPGSMMDVITDALRAADAIAVVVQPSPKDLEAQGAVETLIAKLSKTERALYVINRCDRRSSLPFRAFSTVAMRSTYPPMLVGERVAYVRADADGKTGPDVDSEAAEEIAALWVALKGIADAEDKLKYALRPVEGGTGHHRGPAGKGEGGPGDHRRERHPANGTHRALDDQDNAGKAKTGSRHSH